MDFKDCFSILAARSASSLPVEQPPAQPVDTEVTALNAQESIDDFSSLQPLELVKKFHDLQQERIKVHN